MYLDDAELQHTLDGEARGWVALEQGLDQPAQVWRGLLGEGRVLARDDAHRERRQGGRLDCPRRGTGV